jgi:anti-sigma-K factor RskA
VKLARDEMHVLTGGYALDALAAQETDVFERHLQHCGPCAAEVRGLRETAARLALAKARRPPARLQQRVLAAAYRTRQLPPLPSPHPAPVRRRWLHPAPVRRRWPHPALVRRRWPRPVRILAAAAGAVALVLGMTQLAIAHRPDVSVQTARTSAGGAVTLIVTRSDQDALLTAARLPAPPDGRVYQVWVIGPAGIRSAGFLSGTGLALTGVRAGERVGVTVEPAGGTSQPTTTPIVLVPVPA